MGSTETKTNYFLLKSQRTQPANVNEDFEGSSSVTMPTRVPVRGSVGEHKKSIWDK